MLSEAGVDLMNSFLTFDPDRRTSAKEALCHPWFAEHPLPQNPDRRSFGTSSHNDPSQRSRQRCAQFHMVLSDIIRLVTLTVRCSRLQPDVFAGKTWTTGVILNGSAGVLLITPMLVLTSCSETRAVQSGSRYRQRRAGFSKEWASLRTFSLCQNSSSIWLGSGRCCR